MHNYEYFFDFFTLLNGIIGSTGYAGQELVRLLMQHPDVEIVWYGSRSYIDQQYADVFQNMFQIVDAKCMDDNMNALADAADVIFTATPQGLCASLVNEDVLNKVKIIDLSADFRIKDVEVYEKWYGIKHKSPSYIKEAVYGLCEINREDIKGARLIANPGCYTTCSILTCYPLVKEGFTPHLVPMNRGILATAYASLKEGVTEEQIRAAYDKYYANEKFVRVLKPGVCPETRWVEGSNYVDVNFKVDPRTHRVIMMGAIDNLVKGAAGQAVQNMNLAFDLDESTGLNLVPMFP